MIRTEIFAGILTLMLYTFGDILIKRPSEKAGSVPVSLVVSASSTVVLILLSIFTDFWISYRALFFSALTGILMGTGTLLVIKSLESEQVSDTMSMVAISYAIPVIFGSVALHEAVPYVSWVGIVLIFVGSVTIIFKEMKFNVALLPAATGNALWGLQFITFDYALQFSANFLVIAAIGSTVALLIVFSYAYFKSDIAIYGLYRLEAAVAGVAMGLGLAGALYLILNHIVTLGLSIVAAEPALITLFGKIIYKDKINIIQMAGIAVAMAGILLVTTVG
ncbi:MAG: EamA family transporter [Nitrososphaeria archaeon]